MKTFIEKGFAILTITLLFNYSSYSQLYDVSWLEVENTDYQSTSGTILATSDGAWGTVGGFSDASLLRTSQATLNSRPRQLGVTV